MDAALFAQILSDNSWMDLRELGYKYPGVDMGELVALFKTSVYKTLPLADFRGNALVYADSTAHVDIRTLKLLLTPQKPGSSYGLRAMEDEIASTLAIERIDFDRDSVRKILQGYAPADRREERIFGIKKGLAFIADPTNAISEESIFTLYDMTVGRYLNETDRLKAGEKYRHDAVYVMGQDIEHAGLSHLELPAYMRRFVDFTREDSPMDDLLKAAVIHFYLAYLHPYFDGNGRMARLMHMWFLQRQGYPSTMFVPFSGYIERSRKQYYDAFSLVEANTRISHVTDVTPFLAYFVEHVYNKIDSPAARPDTLRAFTQALESGSITAKERDLWGFVLSAYGAGEFSTKQLERDFGNAAYATIRGFVLKFCELGLLKAQKYGSRIRYSVAV